MKKRTVLLFILIIVLFLFIGDRNNHNEPDMKLVEAVNEFHGQITDSTLNSK